MKTKALGYRFRGNDEQNQRFPRTDRNPLLIALALFGFCIALPVIGGDSALCASLESFADPVAADAAGSIEFQTSWGGGFKGSDERTMFEKRCIHEDYPPAVNACDQLMTRGAIEFSGNNFADALSCLSPETRPNPAIQFEEAKVSFSRGTDDRGARIEMSFGWDEEIGGMNLKIDAVGY